VSIERRETWIITRLTGFFFVALANYVHGKNMDKGFIRIDMSEFQHKVLQTLANF
jgi:hypothetical protein